jgi:nucleoside-diphosphate kinase
VFYREHVDKHYFAGLILAMSDHPCVAVVLEGENAISRVRELNGATNPQQAQPGTIRRDFMSAGGPFNTVHGSDSKESAEREIALVSKWDHFVKVALEDKKSHEHHQV